MFSAIETIVYSIIKLKELVIMKLIVYKGFKTDFLTSVNIEPLIKNDFNKKRDVLNFDKNYKKQLDMALISLQDDESA